MDYAEILSEIVADVAPLVGQGRIADYIPELARIAPDRFGISIVTTDGAVHTAGDADVPFSIQSISKVFTLTLAMQAIGDALWLRTGREPSGNPFNSLVQLEYENGIPRNPFINAGALVVTDVILTSRDDATECVLDLVRALSGNDSVIFDPAVTASEKAFGHRNAALAHFLKSFGNLQNTADAVLDAYFHHCALSMTCTDVARAVQYLARGGLSADGHKITTSNQAKYINSLLLTCGTYDAVGDFAYRVGLPGKSGVGGGIVAVMPEHFTVCVWSPGLNANGNSLAGTRALELLTTLTGQSIF